MSENNYKVYVHISPNGKRYYGITKKKVERRWRNGKGYKSNKYFYRAINKHGWDNFEHIVIAKGLSEEEAKWLEIELIREWDTTNREYGYNITKGGEGTNGYKYTEEYRKKLSETTKGEGNPMYGKKHTEETKKKMSETRKGKQTGKNHPRATKVYCVELDMYFDTVKEAGKYVDCHKCNISHVLACRRKTAGGYHWLYAED